jgi:hypothetical protein
MWLRRLRPWKSSYKDKMMFYKIRPEVPAAIGKNSILERTAGIPLKVVKLHLEFEGWQGGDLLETSPVFYVTERLKEGIGNSKLTGVADFLLIDELTKSKNFLELYPKKEIPKLYLLKVEGTPFKDDFGVDNGYLIISETAKRLLTEFNLSNSRVDIVHH